MLDLSPLKNALTKRPQTAGNGEPHIKPLAENETPVATESGSHTGNSTKTPEPCGVEIGKRLQERLQRAGQAINAYHKALNEDRPPEELALLAAKGFSLAVSEDMIYNQLARKYWNRYGIKLTDGPPFEIIRTNNTCKDTNNIL